MTDQRLKIAVFIDFDNIEIGVKTTLNQTFDISVILEAIKERGEVVTKVAYGDWKRAGDHGRLLSQHAIRLVQRNLTPGGDKNGADINLALDALEMAFTHDHINAFVIVGGDSDFITLVEKLKQYDKKVFVVGGRQFTSLVMQRNCHEFIAYENLVRGSRGSAERRSGAAATSDISKALPLVKRALKVLVDREVTPQLGLLKSTLLQLDSTFSEREYGAGTFRDFIEKVAQTGLVTLRHAGRSLLVDLADTNGAGSDTVTQVDGQEAAVAPAAAPPAPSAPSTQEAVEYAQGLFARAAQTPRWPMYVRQVKQYFRNVDEAFDEKRFGFSSLVEFLRALQRENMIRLERDRQGGLRVFPGAALARPSSAAAVEPVDGDEAAPAGVAEEVPVYQEAAYSPDSGDEPAAPVESATAAAQADVPPAPSVELTHSSEEAPARSQDVHRHAHAADDHEARRQHARAEEERRDPGVVT
ncbi:MAG TPA: NYN domain-containing protein [Vicinamibacterales bacterium]|nr:NYN domain-containing protein [Vicinamibacterales bacterium]